jgi:outer membrane protein TolC
MRPSSKITLRRFAIGISCVGLLFVFCNSLWTQETKIANPNVKELQKQRLAVLVEIRDAAKKIYETGHTDLQVVLTADRALLDARVAYAEARKDRIKACDEAIQNAIEFHQSALTRKRAARATQLEVLKAQDSLLEAQIMRENAATGE